MKLLTVLAIATTALALTGCDPQPKADEPTAETNASTTKVKPTTTPAVESKTATPTTR